MMNVSIINQPFVECPDCSRLAAEKNDLCGRCDAAVKPAAPETVFGKIKRALGIEISSDIITINLEDTGYFFSKREIESLLNFEEAMVLDLEDVPDRDKMFYQSKTIRKPLGKNKIK